MPAAFTPGLGERLPSAPNIHRDLREAGIRVGRKRVARLIRRERFLGETRRRFCVTTVRQESNPVAPDLVKREFTACEPNRLWVADITYIPTWAGFLYLAVVLDVWSRRIVGWVMATHLRTELVSEALKMAIARREPKEVIHHSESRLPIHLDRVWTPLQPRGRTPFNGIGRGCLRQRDGGIVFLPPWSSS